MKPLMNALCETFSIIGKDLKPAFIALAFIFYSALKADALKKESALPQSIDQASCSRYTNYAEKELYENEPYFLAIPQWHYYDLFGNYLLDGFHLYGISSKRNDTGTGFSNIALHPFLKKMLDNLVTVSDLHDNSGALLIVSDKITSEFTSFTFKQSVFAGARLDAFYKENFLSLLTNRISYTGFYGMLSDESRPAPLADWLTGIHAGRKINEASRISGTYVNIHHDESNFKGKGFNGIDYDTLPGTPTGLSLYGLDLSLSFDRMKAYIEYSRSQKFLDGRFKPKAGNAGVLNGYYDFFEKLRAGSELYYIGSRFQTDFSCSSHQDGDVFGGFGKYHYSLVEDNDDRDEYPENGIQGKMDWFPTGRDFDGTLPAKYDRNKNGILDSYEDFLSYEADPIDSKILFDRNSNGIPDEIEDDPYPDHAYVPGYYLPGEKTWKNDTINYTSSQIPVHKGLAGIHLYGKYKILENLEVSGGGIFEKSLEKTYQKIYENGGRAGEIYTSEKALNLYLLANYRKDFGRDKYLLIGNFLRRVADNIPNHTCGFSFAKGTRVSDYYPFTVTETVVNYNIIPDNLDYRDVAANAIRAEFTLSRNRGFNFTSAAKYEFQKHFPVLQFNYPEKNISSLWLINKCKYIYPLPVFNQLQFLKDIFIIPQVKNVYEFKGYGAPADSLNEGEEPRNNVSSSAAIMLQWRITPKSSVDAGCFLKRFDDFINKDENYLHPALSLQLTVKDRYKGCAMVLVGAVTWYAYLYNNQGIEHNIRNNAHGVTRNTRSHTLSIKVYCGYL